jgi:signal transduction histidine kinase/HPt (histidine-containing phosphotransfer) domain-containing protein
MAARRLIDGLTVRAKLVLVSMTSVVLVAGIGGAWMMHTAKDTLARQIDSDLHRSAELMTSLVMRTSDANVQSYLLGIAAKNAEILTMLQNRVQSGEFSLKKAQACARDLLLAQHIGDTGYIYAIDSSGVMRVHPNQAMVGADLSQNELFKRQNREKFGYIEYEWQNPGETKPRPKALTMVHFPAWDWIISATSYREEFNKLLNVADLSKSILSIHFGETGYAFVITEEGDLVIHPTLAGQNILNSVDESGRSFIREMCRMRQGQISYMWRNPGEAKAREKRVVFRHLPDRKWIVATCIYTDDLYGPLTRLRTTLWATVVGVLALLVTVLWASGAALARPLRNLMGRIAAISREFALEPDAAAPAPHEARDELVLLTRQFEHMATAIRVRDQKLREHQHNLEELVQRRTLEISTRNAEMQLVLDTVDQGLATVDLGGKFGTERSAMFRTWFGEPADPDAPFYATLVPRGSTSFQMFWLAWDALQEDILPLEVNVDQLPKRFERASRHYSVNYRPIVDARGNLSRILLVISDETMAVLRRTHEEAQKEFLSVFERIMRDRVGFIEFFNETSRLVDALAARPDFDAAELLRSVHTLKGNSSLFGLTSISDTCNALEKQTAQRGPTALREGLPALIARWGELSSRVVPLIGTRSDNIVEVEFLELERFTADVRAHKPTDVLLAGIERLKAEPAEARLQRFAEQARHLATRLDKAPIEVLVRGNAVRLPLARWGDFWATFVHVIRNAIDHGIEPTEERVRAGKRVPATISLAAREEDGWFFIEVHDDGRGIDWEALRANAEAAGLPTSTEGELLEALFADGLSTKAVATDISGRGVGMAAVREAASKLGGTIRVQSITGAGTTLVFRIPTRGNCSAPNGSERPGVRPSLEPPITLRPA